ncbi:MAG TPA: HDOD domain-containing protein [Desulfurivibrio alkaliphilus]|uniref:HDOD domain-containing protein n=1 Tax=Desulfurivibrio alkaliphilus TaxID=427923 RepID=A0A7C2X923_9BACT|nr:HDOD domain-containing protein [Desulfurivibrio alkaliphilus]
MVNGGLKDDDGEALQPQKRLDEIFAKMKIKGLPAMSGHVRELISLTQSSRSAAYELAQVILKDYSLTNKVLQVVNSAYYSLGRPVNSISKAVTILGFDAVRDLAMAIALFENFVKSGADKEKISRIMTCSFLSAMQARDLAVDKNLEVAPEEAFICALLHNLGKIIVCVYIPESYARIEKMVADGVDEALAVRETLDGLDYQKIGIEVAIFWNLSKNVIAAMDPRPRKPLSNRDRKGYLCNLASFANQLTENVCGGKSLEPLLRRYGQILYLRREDLTAPLERSIAASEDMSDSLRYGLAKLKIGQRLHEAEETLKNPGGAKKDRFDLLAADGMVAATAPEPEPEAVEVLEESSAGSDQTPEKSIDDFIRELTETLLGPINLNDFYINLLEGLYRGVGFDRVLLVVLSIQPGRRVLIGRFGFGDLGPEKITFVTHDLEAGGVISQAIKQGKDMAVPPDTPGAFAENLAFLVRGRMVYLFPVCLDGKPIALIYLDRKKGRPKLDVSRIKTTRLFRDFAVMAIRKLRGGNN